MSHYLRTEIRKHWDRLKRISKLTDKQLQESYEALLSKITFINEELIPQKVWEDAEKLTTGIDVDDTVFVALTKYVKGKLWSGDNTLQAGLKKKGYKAILTTPEIHKLWIKKREKLK